MPIVTTLSPGWPGVVQAVPVPSLINAVLVLLEIIVFADVILSWVKPSSDEFPRKFTASVTDPLCAPIRSILNPQKMGGLDVSPIIILLLLRAMRSMLESAL